MRAASSLHLSGPLAPRGHESVREFGKRPPSPLSLENAPPPSLLVREGKWVAPLPILSTLNDLATTTEQEQVLTVGHVLDIYVVIGV